MHFLSSPIACRGYFALPLPFSRQPASAGIGVATISRVECRRDGSVIPLAPILQHSCRLILHTATLVYRPDAKHPSRERVMREGGYVGKFQAPPYPSRQRSNQRQLDLQVSRKYTGLTPYRRTAASLQCLLDSRDRRSTSRSSTSNLKGGGRGARHIIGARLPSRRSMVAPRRSASTNLSALLVFISDWFQPRCRRFRGAAHRRLATASG